MAAGAVSDLLNHSFRNRASGCLMNGSLNHWLKWFVQKQSKWLSLWMDHWIIDSIDSFRNRASGCLYEWIIESLTQSIRSETEQVAVFMNGSLNHWLKWFVQKQSKWLSLWMDHWIIDSNDSFRNRASGCLYEWIIESLTQMICSETEQVAVFMNGSLNHWLKWFVQKQSKWLSLWMDHWIIDSNDSFRNRASGCLYEWIIESLTQMIRSETEQVAVFMNGSLNHWLKWFIQKQSKWLSLWMDHWIIDSNDLFRNRASGCLYEWIIESLTQMIRSETEQVAVFMNGSLNHWLKWFVQKQSKWLSLWMDHWIIDSNDSFINRFILGLGDIENSYLSVFGMNGDIQYIYLCISYKVE